MKLLLFVFIWLICVSAIPEITIVVTLLWLSIVFVIGITKAMVKVLDSLF